MKFSCSPLSGLGLRVALVASTTLWVACSDSTSPEEPGTGGAATSTVPKTFGELVGDPLIVISPTLQTVLGLPEMGYEAVSDGLPVGGTWRRHPSLGDLDGDGRADLIATNREENGLNVWRSMPDGSWEPRMKGIPDNLMYGGSDIGDLDGDGDADFVFAAHKVGLRVFLNDGKMNWTEVEGAAEIPFLALDVSLGNLNGDEHLDAVTIAQFKSRSGGLAVYFGRGDGTFELQAEHQSLMGRSKMGEQVELQDLDGNGLDDLFLTAEWSCLIYTTHLSQEGVVRFDDHSEGLPVPPKKMGNILRSFVPMDVQGDGVLEVAFAGMCDPGVPVEERHSLGVYRWIEGGADERSHWEVFGEGLEDGLAYRDVLAADFDGDGKDDLITMGPGLGVSVYRGDGSGNFEPIGMLAGTEAGGRGALGDIDNDGRIDVAISVGATKSRPVGAGVRAFLNRKEAWEK